MEFGTTNQFQGDIFV